MTPPDGEAIVGWRASAGPVRLPWAPVMALLAVLATASSAGAQGHRRPDLVVVRVAASQPAVAPGRSFVVEDVTARRRGRGAKASRTRYWLRAGRRGIDLGGRPVPRLRRAGRSRGAARVAVPPATADGVYRLVACADAARQIRERREDNNCRTAATPITVDAQPPPAPSIDAHPDETTASHQAHFAFGDAEPEVTFTCALDAGAPVPCRSPHDVARVEAGAHEFAVTATDAAGNPSAAARFGWTVVPDEVTLGDGAWSWFADPRAIHDPVRRRTYVGWVACNGDVKVAAYDHATLTRTTADLHPRLQVDDHAGPALQVLPDGRLRVFYSAHGRGPMYFRTASAPGSVTAWEPERTVPVNTPGPRGYTYPNPVRLAAESRTYLFWRGGNFNPSFATQADGADAWSAARTLISVPGERPYVKVDSDGEDTIHVAFTNAHPREAPDVNLYYVALRGGRLRRADGTPVGSLDAPLEPRDADLVYDGPENVWVHDVAHDADGRPVIVFARFPTLADHRYMYARWTGSAWSVHEIVAAGGSISADANEPQYSAGVTLDHDDPSVVYLSRPVAGVPEIETWRTTDGGARWTHQAVTAGSQAGNVRPVAPRGRLEFSSDVSLVWMHGIYTSYLEYRTSLRTILMTGGNAPPIADAALAPRSGRAPLAVTFDGRGSRDEDGEVVDWRWDFGDGRQASGPQATHTYTTPGRYFPTLTVRDASSAVDLAVEEVEIAPPPASTG